LEADLTLLRRQDAAAFSRLVKQHQGLVLGLCQSMGLSRADADDAAAEAFAAVYRALPGFGGRSQVGTWVYQIAFRTILKVRRRYRRGETVPLGEEDVAAVGGESVGPESLWQDAETARAIWAAVAGLEPRQAAAVELFYRREWPVERIAAALECPVGTVKTLLFRARARLKEIFVRQEITP
jgi:RNA polymerase sigma-70 factor (ECF subfamily)